MTLKLSNTLSPEKTSRLPKNSGIYGFFSKEGEILYVGKAGNIRERVKNHFQQPTFRDNLFIGEVKKIGWVSTDSEIEALILEANLIKKFQPKYNVLWRDDKNYFYVGIAKEELPRVFITHQIKQKTKNSKLKTNFIGPFVEGTALKRTLRFLRKVFPYYTKKSHPKTLCLWCHLKLCPGPEPDKKEYKKNVKNLIAVLKGRKPSVLNDLRKEMKIASSSRNFEKAAKLRDQINALEKIVSHAKIFQQAKETSAMNYRESEKELRKILGIKNEISRIEAYDVSNIQGKQATGSMVTFIKGEPDKNFYRKFKIRVEAKPNDILMLKECLNRRFLHPEWGLPDLILIDGGKAQLNAAMLITKNYKLKTKLVSLAKKKNELFFGKRKKPVLLKNLPREISNLILRLRDEAHRFALSYHHKLRVLDLRKNL